jgi:SAM-dependent methyltransferase
MNAPARSLVEDFYDGRVAEKLRDFTHPLPRIEAAIETLAAWAPESPRRVLEIGCGVGATSWRMARAWPDADVVGVDISPGSIAVASACFRRPNLTYRAGVMDEWKLDGEFDLVLMMDVYEHIPPGDRPRLHTLLKSRLAPQCRFVLAMPTPAYQQYARDNCPETLQPVDEDIGPAEIATLAAETETEMLYYRQVGVWNYGDYFHLVLGRFDRLREVALRQPRAAGLAALKVTAKRMLGRPTGRPVGRRDYLGADLVRPAPSTAAEKFVVPLAERRALAAAWLRRAGNAG